MSEEEGFTTGGGHHNVRRRITKTSPTKAGSPSKTASSKMAKGAKADDLPEPLQHRAKGAIDKVTLLRVESMSTDSIGPFFTACRFQESESMSMDSMGPSITASRLQESESMCMDSMGPSITASRVQESESMSMDSMGPLTHRAKGAAPTDKSESMSTGPSFTASRFQESVTDLLFRAVQEDHPLYGSKAVEGAQDATGALASETLEVPSSPPETQDQWDTQSLPLYDEFCDHGSQIL
jgi:hypothetical protein